MSISDRLPGTGRLPRLRVNPWVISATLAFAVIAWMLSGDDGPAAASSSAATTSAQPTQTVEVVHQRATEYPRRVSVYGRTAPVRTATLRAETAGRVVRITRERGDQVGSGEVLLELDLRDREARLATARALVRQREVEHEAQQRLANESYVSASNLAEAEANLESARGDLRRAQLDLEYRQLRAPFDGAIQERMVEVGDYVKVGDPLVEFVDKDELIVIGSIAEREIGGVQVGAPGTAQLATGETVSGSVRYIAPVADAATRTFTVELLIPNDGSLRGGVTAQLDLEAGIRTAHRVAPSLLTLDDSGRLGVKLVEDGRVSFAAIEIIGTEGGGTWVTGLPDEAAIITVGQGWVRDGDAVEVVLGGADRTASRDQP